MFYWRKEGDGFPRNGFYFYRPGDPGSVGVIIRLGRRVFRVRYSKIVKRLFVSVGKLGNVGVFELPETVIDPTLNTRLGTYYYGHKGKWIRLKD